MIFIISTRRKIWLIFLGIVILTGIVFYVDWPKSPPLKFHKWGIDIYKTFPFHLGLDLQGGTHLEYEADVSNIAPERISEAMGGVRDVIERRVNIFGVTEPVVQVEGKNRLIVELAGVKDISQAIKMIGETPSLDFREEMSKEDFKKLFESQNQPLPPDFDKAEGPFFIPTSLTGKDLVRAVVEFNPTTYQPEIGLEFNDNGKKLFAEITERNVGKRLAIYLDGVPISAPTVREPIRDGKAVISGNFTIDEARLLAMRLNAGALPVPIKLISQQSVEASLGKDSLNKSLIAGIIGLVAVGLFMILYYRLAGLLAVIALIIYGLVVLALFKVIPVTLTLAGIAGFILSIGMAVDANVLIFERMREEKRQGRDLRAAAEEGIRRAWPSIRDSNITTLIICAVLFWFGTGLIKGFALTLGIGVLISMFSAIIITQTFLKLLIIPVIEKRKWFFGI